MNDSRKVSPLLGDREPLGAVASGLPSSHCGQAEGASASEPWSSTGSTHALTASRTALGRGPCTVLVLNRCWGLTCKQGYFKITAEM
ncbi:hypothetical protein FOMG_19681, partial [Fusarium oxysporum f. sp. melonis 26406]